MEQNVQASENKAKVRDGIVDLIRIIACIIVIGCHIDDLDITSLDKTRILFNMIFSGDCIAIFFMMIGFFLFKNKSFKKLLKKVLLNIFLPAIVVIILTDIFSTWIYNHSSFYDCIKNFQFNYKVFFEQLLKWAPMETAPHLWYIFSYMKIILMFPILRLVVKNENATKYVLLIGMVSMIYTDYVTFCNPTYKYNTFYPLELTFLYPIIGYEIYRRKDKIKSNKKIGLIAFGILVISQILRYILRYLSFKNDITANIYWHWNTSFACVFSICLIIIILSFSIKNEKVNKVICFIGQRTFVIYLIHMAFVCYIHTRGFSPKLFNILGYTQETSYNMSFIHECIYILIKLALVFSFSFVIATILHFLKVGINKTIQKIKK